MHTSKHQFELEGPEISEMQTLKRDLVILKNIQIEINKVNYKIPTIDQQCGNAIDGIKNKIGDLVAKSYLKILEGEQ